MPRFQIQRDGSAILHHDDGRAEPVRRGDVAARYAELAAGGPRDVSDDLVLEALRRHMGGGQSSETTQLPESLTQTSVPSE